MAEIIIGAVVESLCSALINFALNEAARNIDFKRQFEQMKACCMAIPWEESQKRIIVGHDDKTVTLLELIRATGDFSDKKMLGRGILGTVYVAKLKDRKVAVKKLFSHCEKRIPKLNSLAHENLIQLLDVHIGEALQLLVYENMEHISLENALFDNKIKLDWEARFNICVGIAKGLQYLHEHPRLKMVHWGIKAANILLDGELKPKISDLGLASTSMENDDEASHFLWMMKTEASTGYMSPEYPAIGKKSGYKYDVYSFGVVMLEIVCGRKNVEAGHKYKLEFEMLVDKVCVADSKGMLLNLVDKSLCGIYDRKQAMIILKLAMKCTSICHGLRPTMSQVVSVLADNKPLDEVSSEDLAN